MEEDFDLEKAMAQIEQGVTIFVPRLTQEEIEAHTRPRKRQAKRKYHFLSFDLSDEEDDFYEPASRKSKRKTSSISLRSSAPVSGDDESSSSKRRNSKEIQSTAEPSVDKPPSKSRRRNSKGSRRKTSRDTALPADETSSKNPSDELPKEESKPALDKLKPLITTEVKLLKPPKEEPITYMEPSMQTNPTPTPCETKILPATNRPQPAATTPANPLIGKIRVKSARELGSTVIFDDEIPVYTSKARCSANNSNSKTGSFKKASTSSSSASSIAKTEPSNAPPAKKGGIDIQLIGDLYAKLFTTKNQTKIRNVAEILQSIAENIKNNNERVQEITNNKSLTDAEKLMRRCLAFQDLKRKQEENEIKLKEKFEAIMAIFDNDNFELLFQLFFLGILKILIVSVSYFYKKGTIFKRLITLLLQSLNNSKFTDERVFKLLRSKDFRERCITLVQFIEKYCKTEFFSMLFLSDADKTLIKNKASQPPEPSTTTTEERPSSLQRTTRPEMSSVQERESFLLHLLKESKAVDPTTPTPSATTQQQNAYKTYAPAPKRAPSALPATTNVPPKPASNSNGPVNSFIFSDGQIKPYPTNNVINIHTTEASRTDRPSRPPPPHYQANNYPRRPPAPALAPVLAPAPGNPVDTTYPLNNSYNGLHKVQLLNGGLNGTHPISTSNGNIENIQPGSYVAPHNKKLGKDNNTNSWVNGPPNVNVNYINSANAGLRMDYYGGSTTFASPRDPRNIWG